MSPQQALALGVRLFVVWFALTTVQGLFVYFSSQRGPDEMLGFVIGGTVFVFVFLLALWRFPKSIANGLLPDSTEAPTPALPYQTWFALGTALLGLWFVASAISPILRNLSVMYILRPELVDPEDMRSLRVGILYYAIEIVIGLCLLVGATGLSKLFWWARRAGSK